MPPSDKPDDESTDPGAEQLEAAHRPKVTIGLDLPPLKITLPHGSLGRKVTIPNDLASQYLQAQATMVGESTQRVLMANAAHVAEVGRSITAALPKFDLSPLISMAARFNDALFPYQGILDGVRRNLAPALEDFARLIRQASRGALPANLRDFDPLDPLIVEQLANEGITVWAVPNAALVRRLFAAPDKSSRREIIGRAWLTILDDCADVASRAVTGRYSTQARFLEEAINAMRQGHVAAGQALATSTLETMLHFSMPNEDRIKMISHGKKTRIDHFRALDLAQAMVFRPIWFTYRPQYTKADLAVASSFARHGVTHALTGRQVNKRNAAQAVMLAASILDFATFWNESRAKWLGAL